MVFNPTFRAHTLCWCLIFNNVFLYFLFKFKPTEKHFVIHIARQGNTSPILYNLLFHSECCSLSICVCVGMWTWTVYIWRFLWSFIHCASLPDKCLTKTMKHTLSQTLRILHDHSILTTNLNALRKYMKWKLVELCHNGSKTAYLYGCNKAQPETQ